MRTKLLLTAIFLLVSSLAAFAAAPTITSFSPALGQVGTLVTITGTNLSNPTAITIGSKTAIVVSNNGTQLVAMVMPGAVTGPVSVTAGGGTAVGSGNFTVSPPTFPTTQQGDALIGSQSTYYSEQGQSVAVSADGNTAIVGAVNNGGGVGASYVYTRSAGVWTQQAQLIGTGESNPNYGMQGQSVALSADGNTAMVGGYLDGSTYVNTSGFIWFFTRTGSTWTQQGSKIAGTGYVIVTNGSVFQGYSCALSADGNTAIEGGPEDNGGEGAAWIFTRSSAGVWTQVGSKLVGTGGGNSQGYSVGMSADGNTALVGSPSGAGGTYVYIRSGNNWVQQGSELTVSGSGGLGGAVALSADGNTALLGAPSSNGAWAFTRTGNTWSQQGAEFTFPNGSVYTGAEEGSAVSLSADGNTAVIGGYGNLNYEGGTWVYFRSGNNFVNEGGFILGTGADFTTSGEQGTSVALSATGTTALVGAPENNTYTGLAFVLVGLPPSIATTAATNVTATTADINGNITTGGVTATVDFEWGTDPNLVGATTTTTFSAGSNPVAINTSNEGFTSLLTGLKPSTTYYFLIDGTNTNGTANGTILSFTTQAPPPPTSTITFSLPPTAVYGTTIVPVVSSTDTTTPIVYRSAPPGYVVTVTPNEQLIATFVASTYVEAIQYIPGTTTIEGEASANITILPAPLTIVADNQTIPYGAAIPQLTVTYDGLVNGDTPATFPLLPTVTTTATVGSVAGTYPITASGAGDVDYNISYAVGTLTINALLPAAVTQAATLVSGSGATLNGTVSDGGASTMVQFLYGTDPNLTGASTLAVTTGVSPIPAGTGTTAFTGVLTGLNPGTTYYYEITGANSAGTNGGGIQSFTTTSVPGGVITFTAPTSAVYGTADLTPNGTSTNTGSPITYTSSNTAVATIVNGNIHVVGAGSAQITASQAGNSNYGAATPVSVTFTVTPAPLTITANDQTWPYAGTEPALTLTYTTLVNGDTPASLTTQPIVSTTATATSALGSYPITVSGAVDPNYTITYVAGTLQVIAGVPTATTLVATGVGINGATLNGTANDDGAAITVNMVYSTAPDLSSNPVIIPVSTNSSGMSIVNYNTVVSGLTAATTYYFRIEAVYYNGTVYGNILSFTTLSLQVQTITFSLQGVTYGSPDVTPGATSTNTTIPITYTSSNTAVATITSGGNIHIVGAGTTIITASQAGNSTYSPATPVTENFTVTPAPLTVTAHNETKVYGSAKPNLVYQYSGFVNGDDSTKLSAQATISTTATPSSGVGNYPITLSGVVDANYNISYVGATLSVTPAALTITANNQTKVQGTANPALTATYTGFVNNDTADDLSSQPVLATTATTSSEAGTYAITASGAVDPNYTITYVPGTLTITPPLVFNQISSKTYGDPDFNPGATGTNVTYSSGNTTVVTITDGGNVHIVGTGSVTITATSGGTSISQTVVINPAPLTVAANDQSRTYGADNPALTLTYNGFVYSDNAASLSTPPGVATTATASSDVGNYPITVSGAADPNYSITYVPGKLSVTPAALTITANDQTKVQGAANPLLTVTYTGFVNNNTADDLTSSPTVTTTALTSSDPGTYPITVSGAVDPNYAIAYVSGTLTILPPPTLVPNNILSPNGDGVNDVWIVHDIQYYPDNTVTIYDRAGRQVYSARGYNNDWAGTANGKDLAEGTYYYVLVLKPTLPVIRGFISIIRSK